MSTGLEQKLKDLSKKIFLAPDILTLHATEYGERRQSTIYCRFELTKKFGLFGSYNNIEGDFYSMVADQKGKVWLSNQAFAQSTPQVIKK